MWEASPGRAMMVAFIVTVAVAVTVALGSVAGAQQVRRTRSAMDSGVRGDASANSAAVVDASAAARNGTIAAAEVAADAATETDASVVANGTAVPTDAALNNPVMDDRREHARRAFEAGIEAFRRGDFTAAARNFQEAYDTLPDPAPMFNLARSLEGMNDVPRAIAAYQRYLEEAPNARDRAAVLQRIQQLQSRHAQVFVSSEPPGAFITVDNEPQSRPIPTPVLLSLEPGPRVIALEHDGYRRTVRRIIARAGETQTVAVQLPQAGAVSQSGTRSRVEPRILNRRVNSILTPRFSFLLGMARPWNGLDMHLAFGGEAAAAIGRYIAGKVHVERVEPDGLWTIVTADFGYMLAIEDIDVSIFACAGAGSGWQTPGDYAAARASGRPSDVFVMLGAELRVDYVFHPHLAVGIYLRAMWRNFFSPTYPVEPLNSLGLSVSLSP